MHGYDPADDRILCTVAIATIDSNPYTPGHTMITVNRLPWSGTIALLDTPADEPGSLMRVLCSQPQVSAPWKILPIPLANDATPLVSKERIGTVHTIRIDGNRVLATGDIDTNEPPGTTLPVAVTVNSPTTEPDDDGTLRVTDWRITQVGLTERPCWGEASITLAAPTG